MNEYRPRPKLVNNIKLIRSNKILFNTYKKKFDLIKKYIKKKNTLEVGSGSGISKYFLKCRQSSPATIESQIY